MFDHWFRKRTGGNTKEETDKFRRPSAKALRFKSVMQEEDDTELAQLESLRAQQKETVTKLNEKNDLILRVHELNSRISHITRRNKKRKILVIPFAEIENPFVDMLLDANSNAEADYASSFGQGIQLLRANHYDMIYVVVDMAAEGHGPCFFSMDNPNDRALRDAAPGESKEFAEMIKSYANGAEIVVVCGTSAKKCPVAGHLFEDRNKYRKEAV